MGEWAKEHGIPLIFLVLKSSNDSLHNQLVEIIQNVTFGNDFASSVILDTTFLELSQLEIAGDFHPNAHYHLLIAEALRNPVFALGAELLGQKL